MKHVFVALLVVSVLTVAQARALHVYEHLAPADGLGHTLVSLTHTEHEEGSGPAAPVPWQHAHCDVCVHLGTYAIEAAAPHVIARWVGLTKVTLLTTQRYIDPPFLRADRPPR